MHDASFSPVWIAAGAMTLAIALLWHVPQLFKELDDLEVCLVTHQCMVRPCVARGFVELAVSGLASMYPAFDWSVMLRATMDISARAISLADRPQRAIWVTSVRMRREDRSSISSHPLADLGR